MKLLVNGLIVIGNSILIAITSNFKILQYDEANNHNLNNSADVDSGFRPKHYLCRVFPG